MAFYVSLGPRAPLIRFGTLVISIWGGLVYNWAYRRRVNFLSDRVSFCYIRLTAGVFSPLEDTPSLPDNTAELAVSY